MNGKVFMNKPVSTIVSQASLHGLRCLGTRRGATNVSPTLARLAALVALVVATIPSLARAQTACDPLTVPNSFGRGVVLHDGAVFTVDQGTRTVLRYAADGTLLQSITPSPQPPAGSNFGLAMDSDDDVGNCAYRIVIGDPGDDSNTGAIYLGSRITTQPHSVCSGNWSFTKQVPPDELTEDCPPGHEHGEPPFAPVYGSSVAIDGGLIVVGAPGFDTCVDLGNGNFTEVNNIGAAYVSTTSQPFLPYNLADLVAPLPASAGFGSKVELLEESGGDPARIAVTAPGEDTIYFFRKNGPNHDDWELDGPVATESLVQVLSMSRGLSGPVLGIGIALPAGFETAFYRYSGQWSEEDRLGGRGTVVVDGDRAVIANGLIAGRARLLTLQGTEWVESRVLDPPNGTFGPVDIDGDLIVVANSPSGGGTGAESARASQEAALGTLFIYDAPQNDCNNDCVDDLTQLVPNCNGDSTPDGCQTDQWNATTGNFSEASNWLGEIVPEAKALVTNALLASPSTCTLTQSATVCSLTVAGNSQTEIQRLTIHNSMQLNANVVDVTAYGVIDGSGTLGNTNTKTTVEVDGSIQSTSAELTINGSNLTNNGIVKTVGADLTISTNTLTQDGTITCTSTNQMDIAPAVVNGGQITVEDNARLNALAGFSNPGTLDLEGGVLDAESTTLVNTGTITGTGSIDATLQNDGILVVTNYDNSSLGALNILSDVMNEGTIVINKDTNSTGDLLIVSGDYSGGGSLVNQDLCSGCKTSATFGTMDVQGDVSIAASATLSMPSGTLIANGNVDIAIDDPARFNMLTATVQLNGIRFLPSGTQELTLMSIPQGTEYNPLDPPDYTYGTIRLGPNPAGLKLVSSPVATRVLYVRSLELGTASELDLAGHTVYYNSLQADNIQTQIVDTVGGGQIVAMDVAVGVPDALPTRTQLFPAYPNPFEGATTISFALATPSDVQVSLFDLRGRTVRTITRRTLPAGRHDLRWDGRDTNGAPVAAGSYFYRLSLDGFEETKRLLVLR